MSSRLKTPWSWVPSLYFVEGLPYFIVNTISVVMFKDMGMDNGTLAVLTSLISLPWVLKPLWSPIVDILKTKRWWILSMELLMSIGIVLTALSVPAIREDGDTGISCFVLNIVFFVITAFASATHDISADGFYMLGLDDRNRSAFVGIRNTFYRISMVFGQGVLVVLAGWLYRKTGSIPMAWRITLGLSALILLCASLWHLLALPRPETEERHTSATSDIRDIKSIAQGFARSFSSFFTKKGVWMAIAFMLLYRLPEALSVKMLYPFFHDAAANGGLGLSTESYGVLYGTAGVIALLAGGILGGIHISVKGLKHCLMPMALSLALPCSVYLFLALVQPEQLWLTGACIVFDQFGYGYGFTAYTVFMMKFSEGPLKTSHYALCTGFMALSMLLPGLVAGYLQEWLGYAGFFILVMICCIATLSVTLSARRHC